jgi:hypothetical protein
MAGKYGPASVVITLDDGPGGTPRTITPYIREIGGIKIEQINEMSHPFGVNYQASTPVGVQKVEPITLKGHFNTTATVGPHVVLGDPDDDPNDATRTFTFSPGDSKTFTMECRLHIYSVTPKTDSLSEFEGELLQSGLGAWT